MEDIDSMAIHEQLINLHRNINTLQKSLYAANNRADRAEKSLQHYGYTDNGDELWKPPIGKMPDFDEIDKWRNLAEKLENAIKGKCVYCLYYGTYLADGIFPAKCIEKTNSCWQFDEARFMKASDGDDQV